jgi:TonB-linked SusC/RagA family outer membrane protein
MKKNTNYYSFLKKKGIQKLLLIMRLSTIILFLSFLNVSASVFSQNTKITFNLKNVSLKDVITEIESKSDFKFLYRNELVDVNQKVNIDANNESLESVLAKLFDSSNIAYKVFEDNLVVITSKSILQQNITGKITDAQTGEPVPGANIVIEGTTLGTTSDSNGRYSLELPNTNAVIIVSSIGYNSEKIQLSGQASLDIKLVPDITKLDEVIVVGYGTQKKSDVTGSVTSVSKARLSQVPATNLMYAIEGAVAGVNIQQTSSVPGSSASALVRGSNSISANTAPFIVLDGIPFNGNMNDINTNDISSIEILKDASAVAIYGTRGANGVILITTKRGKSGKPAIQYSGYAGYENMAHVLKPRGPQSYVDKYAEYISQTGQTLTNPVPNLYELNNYNQGKTTDWIKEATQQGVIQDHNVSISGGTKDVTYYLSGEYMKQDGVVKGYQYHRASVRSNVDANITDYLTVGTSLLFNNNNYDGGRVNLLNASAMSPYSDPLNEVTGKYEIYPMYPELLYTNPLIGLYNDRIDRSSNLNGNFYAELKPAVIKGLKFRFNGAYTYLPSRYANYSGRDANNLIGTADIRNAEDKTWIIENIITYAKDINKHHIDFTGLYSAQKENYFATALNANTFVNDQLSYYNAGAGATVSAGSIPNTSFTGSYGWQSALLSQMGRINYSYDSRYLLTLTARRDGYSAFGANSSKFGLFPSFALGWNITKENFMQNVKVINNLKLRVSYGKAGNQAVGVNQTATTEGAVRFPFSGVSTIGVVASNLGNSNLNWESTTSINTGLDFGILENRIIGTIDYYKTRTTDILLRRNLPQITGYTSVLDNLGEMENRGIEISLNTVNINTGVFKWETNMNISANKNKLIDLYGDKKDDLGNRWFIGKPLGVIFDYEMVGVWQEGEDPKGWDASAKPGDLKFKDQLTVDTDGDGIKDAADGVINADDRKILGQRSPKWIGGITNTFHYNNLHLSIFIQTSQGALKNNPDYNYADEQGRRNTPEDVGYWTPDNKSNSRPSLRYNNTRGYGFPMDNSFTRIKDVTLSYSFPKSLIDKIKIDNLLIYISGRNLYTFTKWVGWEPENDYSTRGSGDWTNNYPFVRSIVFGANITLR